MSVKDNFPDLWRSESTSSVCLCGHSDRNHWTLGCVKCSCSYFITWEEVDKDREEEAKSQKKEAE